MLTKTLGGDRLGSGQKQKVTMHGYERSSHDKSKTWRTTMSPGTLVPFLKEVALPGDTWDINLNCEVLTHPTIGPLFGSFKVQLDLFVAPIRLYHGSLHNNKLGLGMMMNEVKLPIFKLYAENTSLQATDLDTSQVNPSSIVAYMGIKGVGINNTTSRKARDFNAVPILAYWDIYKNYYANKQEEIGAVLHTPSLQINKTTTGVVITPASGGSGVTLPVKPASQDIVMTAGAKIVVTYTAPATLPEHIIVLTKEHGRLSLIDLCGGGTTTSTTWTGYYNGSKWGVTTAQQWDYLSSFTVNTGKPAIATFPLGNIDNMREKIMQNNSIGFPFDINASQNQITPYWWISEVVNSIPNVMSSQEGLALKTYQSDLFNNWIKTTWLDGPSGINTITAINTSSGSFTIDTFQLAKKVYDMLNRVAVSGGTYDDWLDAVYTHDRYTRCETPMYSGGLSKELVFQEVVSNAASGDEPLGQLAGRGVLSNKHKGGHAVIKIDEPSYIMGIVSLTPRLDYSQGISWDMNLTSLNDLHKPALDQIGFQELLFEQAAWWTTSYNNTTSKWDKISAGKQPAWINYMTNVNEVYGNFAIPDNEMFMVLNRRYEYDKTTLAIKDLTTYIDPSKFNHIFADTRLDAMNFWVQIHCGITARRKMSAKQIPNL